MQTVKCNHCGEMIEIEDNEPVAFCPHCQHVQVLTGSQDERKRKLLDRADSLWAQQEFDQAEEAYRALLQEFPDTADAYWGLVLCAYGVEYVSETGNTQQVPVLLRSSRHSVLENPDYLRACALASGTERRMYQNEAGRFEALRQKYQAISEKEKPYDIFISYKESDEKGGRTQDSVMGQNIYEALTKKGYRVFFSRITLEQILGQEYEPYIFAALHSAKIMLVLGTESRYYTSAWVKNEWGRYLKLMNDGGDRYLIPCYLQMQLSDMPAALRQQHCQDMSQNDALDQLLQMITEKVGTRNHAYSYSETDREGPGFLLKSGRMALEDGSFRKAIENFEKVLVMDNQCAEAYLGRVLAEQQATDLDRFVENRLAATEDAKEEVCTVSVDRDRIDQAVADYASENGLTEDEIRDQFLFDGYYTSFATDRNKQLRDEKRTWEKDKFLQNALQYAAPDQQIEINKALNRIYTEMENRLQKAREEDQTARDDLEGRYAVFLSMAEDRVQDMSQERETERQEQEQRKKKVLEKEKKRTRIKVIAIVSAVLILVAAAVITFFTMRFKVSSRYSEAEAAMNRGDYAAALEIYESFDEVDKVRECCYYLAQKLEAEGKPLEAAMMYGRADHYKDSFDRSTDLWAPYLRLTQIASSESYMGGIRSNGMLFLEGDATLFGSTNVMRGWTDIVDMDMGRKHTIVLDSSGETSYNGKRGYGQLYRSDIVDVAAGRKHTVVLSKLGYVTAKGSPWKGQCRVKKWDDVVAIDCGDYYTLGLRNDGTVLYAGRSKEPVAAVSEWENIYRISAGNSHVVGIQADGTVLAIGSDSYSQCRVENWKDIIDVAVGARHTVGLHSDGTVVAIGANVKGECDVSDWTDVVYIAANDNWTVGVQSNGHILLAGDIKNIYGDNQEQILNDLKNGTDN